MLKNQKQKSIELYIGIGCVCISGVVSLLLYYTKAEYTYGQLMRTGFVIFVLCLAVNITKSTIEGYVNKVHSEIYMKLAYTDSLTGLFTRTAFDEATKKTEQISSGFNTITFILFDIDNLKNINDSQGHIMGDEIIKQTAHALQKAFETYGRCYRIGGDEFIVIGFDKSDNETLNILDNIKNNLPGVSFGYSQISTVGISDEKISDLFNKADANMYLNKNFRKNSENK